MGKSPTINDKGKFLLFNGKGEHVILIYGGGYYPVSISVSWSAENTTTPGVG